ncbi:hypothetical protein BY996DRAFT_8394668, partial [Phakopsora pachyrhizi]
MKRIVWAISQNQEHLKRIKTAQDIADYTGEPFESVAKPVNGPVLQLYRWLAAIEPTLQDLRPTMWKGQMAYLVFQLWTHGHLYNKLHPAQRKHLRLQSLGPVTRSFNPQIPFEFNNFQAIWINKTKDWLNISFNSPGVLSEAWDDYNSGIGQVCVWMTEVESKGLRHVSSLGNLKQGIGKAEGKIPRSPNWRDQMEQLDLLIDQSSRRWWMEFEGDLSPRHSCESCVLCKSYEQGLR